MDMGIEPFLIASSLIGVIAQRLVRILCRDCKGKGCQTCSQSGYKGRTGIYELMILDDSVRQLTTQKASAAEIRKAALSAGMITLRDDGLQKVEQGLTLKEEVLRVTQDA
jgi:general secretion pathway protein E